MAKQVRTVKESASAIKRRNERDRLLEDPYRVLGQAHFLIRDGGVIFRIVILVGRQLVRQAELATHIFKRKFVVRSCLIPQRRNPFLYLDDLRAFSEF